jgi:uncharacterized repeat protein (TIGR01451 family)
MKARVTQLLAAGFSAAALLVFTLPLGAQAAPLVPAGAEGDSYGVAAIVAVAPPNFGAPVRVGPIAPSYATVPPGSTTGSQSGTVIDGPAGPLNPIVSALNVTNDTSKATIVPVAKTDCQPNQAVQDGFTGPLSGGNACSTIANAEVLNQGSVDKPNPVIHATGVFAQSVTQQCDPTQGLPFGSADVVDLTIGGQQVFGSSNKKPSDTGQIPPNTVIEVPSIAKVILNEQSFDNKAGGQGLTVNAIHVFTEAPFSSLISADVIIGHTHSSATCTTAPSKQLCEVVPSTDVRCKPGVIITKTDNTGNETAQPGQTITFTVSIDTKTLGPCLVTQVTDTLPPGFSFVSASGDLGTPTAAGQVLTWFKGTGFAKDVLVETIVAQISPNETDGFFSNQVDTFSNCGEKAGSSPPIHVIVTPPPAAPAAPAAPAGGTQAAATLLPFTSTASPYAAIWLGVIFLGLALSGVAAARLLREGPID